MFGFFVVTMLLRNKSHTAGKAVYLFLGSRVESVSCTHEKPNPVSPPRVLDKGSRRRVASTGQLQKCTVNQNVRSRWSTAHYGETTLMTNRCSSQPGTAPRNQLLARTAGPLSDDDAPNYNANGTEA